MTGEVKETSRKRGHQRSKSSMGEFTATAPKNVKPTIKPKDVLHKTLLTAKSKAAGRDYGRSSWFKTKKAQPKNSDPGDDPERVDLEVEEKQEQLEKPMQRVVQGLYRDDDGGPSPNILVFSHSAAREAIKEFSKDFLAQLKANPCACPAMEAQMRQRLSVAADSPQTDLKLLVQAYITHHFFADFENASFGISNPGEKPWEVQPHRVNCFEQFQKYKTKKQTVSKLLENELNDTFLSRFCMKKFRTLDAGVSSQHHLDLEKGIHPDTPFHKSFLGAAVSMWLLHRLAFSFEQKIVTIYPTRGDAFQRQFMQPAVPGIGDSEDEEGDAYLEILFTVFPGFRVSDSIVHSLVYIVEKPQTEVADSSTFEDEAAEAGQSASPEFENPASPSVDNGATEVGRSASKEGRFHKLYSIPVSISAKLSESSVMKGSQKSSSLKDTSQSKDEENGNLFKKIMNKITRKKGPAKDKAGDDSSTTEAPEATAAHLPFEGATPALPSSLETPPEALEAPSTDAEEDAPEVNASVPGESSPLQLLNTEVVASSVGPAVEDDRLYIPRAEKAKLLQSPLRSPKLSSVD